jgi:hypothetical protein
MKPDYNGVGTEGSMMYQPKKKKYNDLSTLFKEMKDSNVKITEFNGASILTKKHKYILCDGVISIKER